MDLIRYNSEYINIWQKAVDSSIYSPSPLAGPEYVSSMNKVCDNLYIFDADDILIPLIKERKMINNLQICDEYSGMRFNSLIGLSSPDINLNKLINSLPRKCFINLHIPENLYKYHRNGFHEADFIPTEKYPYYVVSLPGNYEEWYNSAGVCRCNIRRAESYDISIKIGGKEYLNDFYKMFRCSYKRWKKAGIINHKHSFQRFEKIFDISESCAKTALALYEDKVIAAVIFCHYKNFAAALNSGMDYGYQIMRPTNLLHAEIIKYLIRKNIEEYHLGGDLRHKKLGQFKKSLGAEEYFSYILNRHRYPRLKKIISKYNSTIQQSDQIR